MPVATPAEPEVYDLLVTNGGDIQLTIDSYAEYCIGDTSNLWH
jgi:hypothetical protein